MKSILLSLVAPLFVSSLLAAPPEAPSPGPTFALSLQDAVKMALENNPDILVEKLGPQSGAEGVRNLS